MGVWFPNMDVISGSRVNGCTTETRRPWRMALIWAERERREEGTQRFLAKRKWEEGIKCAVSMAHISGAEGADMFYGSQRGDAEQVCLGTEESQDLGFCSWGVWTGCLWPEWASHHGRGVQAELPCQSWYQRSLLDGLWHALHPPNLKSYSPTPHPDPHPFSLF